MMALHFSEEEFARRKNALIHQMDAAGVEAMLLFSQESMYWLTGYDTFGFCFFQCLVVTTDGRQALLTRSADLRQAQHTSNIQDIRIWPDRQGADPTLELRDLMDEFGLLGASIGVEYDTHGLTAHNGRLLEQRMRSFARPVDASDMVSKLRLIKSDEELAFVRKAGKNADKAYDAALSIAAAGANEGQILAAMNSAVFENGGDYPANEFIIGSGSDALLCRYKSGRRKLSKNDQLTLEWAGTSAHYHAAMMQTVPIGNPSELHLSFHAAARETLERIEEAMTPGTEDEPATLGDLFAIHAAVLDQAGLSRHRLNACGYSLGARFAPSWMEREMIYADNPTPIVPNMVLFAHMIIMDSDTQTAMTLGRSFITTDGPAEKLSKHNLNLTSR